MIQIFSFSCSGSTLHITMFTSFWKCIAELLGEILQSSYHFKMQRVGFKSQNFRRLQSKRVITGSYSWRLKKATSGHNGQGLVIFFGLPLEPLRILSLWVLVVLWCFFQFKSSLNTEIIAWQPIRVLALQHVPARLAGDTYPARSLLRCVGGLLRTGAAKPGTLLLTLLTEQLLQWSLLRLVSEAISWLTPRESQEWRNIHATRTTSDQAPAGGWEAKLRDRTDEADGLFEGVIHLATEQTSKISKMNHALESSISLH